MSYTPLPPQVSQWIKITKSYTDFAASALTNTVTLYTPTNQQEVIEAVSYYTPTGFSGGGIATYLMKVQWGTSGTNIIGNTNMLTPAVLSSGFMGSVSTQTQGNPDGAGRILTAVLTSTGANLDQATQGTVDFWIKVSYIQP